MRCNLTSVLIEYKDSVDSIQSKTRGKLLSMADKRHMTKEMKRNEQESDMLIGYTQHDKVQPHLWQWFVAGFVSPASVNICDRRWSNVEFRNCKLGIAELNC